MIQKKKKFISIKFFLSICLFSCWGLDPGLPHAKYALYTELNLSAMPPPQRFNFSINESRKIKQSFHQFGEKCFRIPCRSATSLLAPQSLWMFCHNLIIVCLWSEIKWTKHLILGAIKSEPLRKSQWTLVLFYTEAVILSVRQVQGMLEGVTIAVQLVLWKRQSGVLYPYLATHWGGWTTREC